MGMAVKDLFRACRDDDEIVRYRAGLSLKGIGKPAVPYLTAALRDPDPGARGQAAWLLGKMGAEAEEAVPALTDLGHDGDPGVRSEAQTAVNRIRSPTP